MSYLSPEAVQNYEKALALGKKEGQKLPALETVLAEERIFSPKEMPLGQVQIPLELVVGTKTESRGNSFSKSFYPLMGLHTEFSDKWVRLYQAHMDEGIHDPIQAYEYMNRFYVAEGNKRVSILKYMKADSVQGNVIRIIPPMTGEKNNRIYYEFMDFYRLSEINYIWFSKEGSFSRLQKLTGKSPDAVWSDTDKSDFSSVFTRFTKEFRAKGGASLPITAGDAFLSFLEVYDFGELAGMGQADMRRKVDKFWEEFKLLITDDPIKLQMTPAQESGKKNFLLHLIPSNAPKQKAAFLYGSTIRASGWTYAHELGRRYLQRTFEGQVETAFYEGVTEENAGQFLDKAVEDGSNLIFTTSPYFLKASLKMAVEHPEVKILNCSLNTAYRSIRTYYARVYEAKFLMGAIAGAISANGKIGYIADYPVWGSTANINAFALGAKMVNSSAQIYLEWLTVKTEEEIHKGFIEEGIRFICGRDYLSPSETGRHFGLYRANDSSPLNVAMPVWHWGNFYEKVIRSILNGSWKDDNPSEATKGLNYWWGMSTGIVDVFCSKHLPIGTARLIELLKKTICAGDFNPFAGILYSQTGVVQGEKNEEVSPERIMRMDWLAENVVGSFPKINDLKEKAKPMVLLQGIQGLEEKA